MSRSSGFLSLSLVSFARTLTTSPSLYRHFRAGVVGYFAGGGGIRTEAANSESGEDEEEEMDVEFEMVRLPSLLSLLLFILSLSTDPQPAEET